MPYLRTAVTFFRCRLSEIRKLWQKRCMLYLVCENGPKIPVGTCFVDLQGQPVQKSATTLAAARIAGWGSCSMLLSTAVAVCRCDLFSIWRRLYYRALFCKKYKKFIHILYYCAVQHAGVHKHCFLSLSMAQETSLLPYFFSFSTSHSFCTLLLVPYKADCV